MNVQDLPDSAPEPKANVDTGSQGRSAGPNAPNSPAGPQSLPRCLLGQLISPEPSPAREHQLYETVRAGLRDEYRPFTISEFLAVDALAKDYVWLARLERLMDEPLDVRTPNFKRAMEWVSASDNLALLASFRSRLAEGAAPAMDKQAATLIGEAMAKAFWNLQALIEVLEEKAEEFAATTVSRQTPRQAH